MAQRLLSSLALASLVSASFWGRIYLRDGMAPIQYFKDTYGGAVPTDELQLVFPVNTLGCTPFDDDDKWLIENDDVREAYVVLDRGNCTFDVKSMHAQAAGAAGVILVSTDEESVRPVAHVSAGEITIPTVMVRHSAGDLFRAAAARQAVFGKLVPMACENSVCHPETESDSEFMRVAGSGVVAYADGAKFDFLAATFGGPLVKHPLQLAVASPAHACAPLSSDVADHAVLVALGGNCSILAKVSAAQIAGAAAVIVAQREETPLATPSVETPWEAYNITIPTIMVSHATSSRLQLRLQEAMHLETDATVAEAWEAILHLQELSKWPSKKSRREAFLTEILAKHCGTQERRDAVRTYFINVAGGSPASWDKLFAPVKDEL
ncbi:hypothetical protein SPRG_04075 [Saprolegnia parasitica CBS 223.65]|uniref:PA domain-containing protein n=1 Tax=Saprolegnia parasitica (strain CBS 223.65) TaxID=695850 RepID=A0A067CQC2_SAPPC|nr:hypothetical protein SPRG_04075 [Saprolegnia parasitica CBS 223.65]KDO31460.1 hypothetical protein SPRG_04075 [Saprolegnia parasitica CBS 223.65]|eukprot:XP_012198055.1 hypothetical protein SPRG_04075 [Saprolegnia parasitica CBS 223.65]